jgi:hypothetical protein
MERYCHEHPQREKGRDIEQHCSALGTRFRTLDFSLSTGICSNTAGDSFACQRSDGTCKISDEHS